MTTTRRGWVLLLLLLLGAVPSLEARVGRLVGKVLDPDGKPIAGVTVTTTAKSIPELREVATTDERGIFQVDIDHLGMVYTYQFEKPGYLTAQVNHTWNVQGTDRQEFRLQPAPTALPTVPDEPIEPVSSSNPAIAAFNEGVRALKAREWDVAASRLGEAVSHDPQLRQGWRALALVYLEQQRWAEAAEAAEKALALGLSDEPLLQARWEAYRHLGDETKTLQARQDLEKAGRLQEEARRIHNEGVILTKAGDDAQAFASFKEAAEMDPNFQQAWLAVAVTGLKIGRAAEAMAAAAHLLEADPGNEEAIRLQYNAALALGDQAKVADALVALHAVEPQMARDNLFKLATIAFDADDAEVAKQRFLKVLEMDSEHPRANYFLGVLYVRDGKKKEARAHLQKFLRLAPTDPEAETAKGLLGFIGS